MSNATSYPIAAIDSYLGTTQNFKLYNINGINAYILNFSEGTLSGGTSPAWTVSASNPIITKAVLLADSNPIVSLDVAPLQEYVYNFLGIAPTGLDFVIPIADLDPRYKGQYIADTEFPSWQYTDVELQLTFNSLANLTSGSPTSSSGSTMTYEEQYIPRSSMSSKLFKVRKFMYKTALNIYQGVNDLTSYLPQTGTYKLLQFFTGTSSEYTSGANGLVSSVDLLLNQTSRPISTYYSLMQAKNQGEFGRTPSPGYASFLFSPTASGLNVADTNTLKNVDLQMYNTASATTYLNTLAVVYLA
jgi:hypothetical protein